MVAWLGTSWAVFLGVSVLLMGVAAFATGRALAATWRPAWQVLAYSLLLGLAARFLVYALFGGTLTSLTGYFGDVAVLVVIGLTAYRLTHVRRMVSQYPWLYERAGPWRYRARRER